jgi:hypothetical protein
VRGACVWGGGAGAWIKEGGAATKKAAAHLVALQLRLQRLPRLLMLDALVLVHLLLPRALRVPLLRLVRLYLHVLLAARQLNSGLRVFRRVQLAHVLGRALKVVRRPVRHALLFGVHRWRG